LIGQGTCSEKYFANIKNGRLIGLGHEINYVLKGNSLDAKADLKSIF
jgi:hypothetical protein